MGTQTVSARAQPEGNQTLEGRETQKARSLDQVPTRAHHAAKPFDRRGRGKNSTGLGDMDWARENLRRCEEDYLILDIANVLRVLERHSEFVDRYYYDTDMHKVVDRGVVMVLWQIDALAGELQERFLPGLDVGLVHKAIYVVANKSALSARV